MVLLWGPPQEPVIDAVARTCRALGIDAIAADGDELRSVDIDRDLVTRDGRRVPLETVTGVLVRPSGRVSAPESAMALRTLNAWAELTGARVLNRPSASASNRSKPYQLALIADAGFAVPDTLVTTDPDDVRAFCAEHETVVYKSVSGVRSIVSVLDRNRLPHLSDVSTCPTQFQQHVPGIDYRVHVIRAEVFACRVDSDAVDYRYAALSGDAATIQAAALPDAEAERCIRLSAGLGLEFAGIDLRRDDDGVWWCFEVNTAPGFIWFEQHTGLPIAATVALTLSGTPQPLAAITPARRLATSLPTAGFSVG
jgi:glutathione synthase/RimK-type ligase-like ATP-grasp enzyme